MSERTVGLAEIAGVFLKIGAMSYGGPAIMGIMQTEIQEKREWISKPEFVEGLALVNMLPGPGATQLGIFIGHAKAGLAGGVIAGLCFVLPAFLIMLALASAYVAFGTLPSVRNAFYGIGPVVVGIFATSVYRLGKGTIRERSQIAIGVAAPVSAIERPPAKARWAIAPTTSSAIWRKSTADETSRTTESRRATQRSCSTRRFIRPTSSLSADS
jgi:chromate transporter